MLSVGDEYHLTFDVPTDAHGCNPTCRGGPEYVTRLFTFSSQLASDYVGYWRPDNQTFTITVTVEGRAPQTGTGGAKQEAEQAAAQAMLDTWSKT